MNPKDKPFFTLHYNGETYESDETIRDYLDALGKRINERLLEDDSALMKQHDKTIRQQIKELLNKPTAEALGDISTLNKFQESLLGNLDKNETNS